jgi:hypothetical protein
MPRPAAPRRIPVRAFAALAALLALPGPALAQPVTCNVEWAPMRDGTMWP